MFVSTDLLSSTEHTLPLRSAYLVLAVAVIADIMDLIDSSIANLAGPSIRADLGGGQVTVQWVLSAYTAAFAIGLITSARLGDLLGRRRLFLLGLTGFILASLACGLAPAGGRGHRQVDRAVNDLTGLLVDRVTLVHEVSLSPVRFRRRP